MHIPIYVEFEQVAARQKAADSKEKGGKLASSRNTGDGVIGGVVEATPLHEVSPIQLLRRNVKRFRGGLVYKAHRLLYHPTLGLRGIKKRRRREVSPSLDSPLFPKQACLGPACKSGQRRSRER